jgi:predicted ATP-grasp superfamily ATP-dependent carboligase
MGDGLIWESQPELRDPILVAAFEGWNDAGDAASGAADWLAGRTRASRFAWIDSEAHVDYQSRRPTLHMVDGVASSITWPATECFAVGLPERDLVVVRGVEPNVHWKSFCDAVISVAATTGCTTVITLGALLGDVPHTRPVRITGTSTDPGLVAELDLTPSRYEGPTGIVGVLHDACRHAGVPSASFWAPVPHYIATPPNPLCTRALLERVGVFAGLSLDLSGFDALVAMWRAEVDEAIEDNEEIRNYVHELESRIDAEQEDVPDGGDLVEELERYLRDQGAD